MESLLQYNIGWLVLYVVCLQISSRAEHLIHTYSLPLQIMTNKKIPVVSFIFFLMVAVSVSSFSTTCLPHTTLQSNRASFSTWKLFSAMERLHDPSTNAYGRVEHVYSLSEIDRITQKITDDEWTALGSVIAETMLETILEVGDDVLTQRGWVERMSVTNKVSSCIHMHKSLGRKVAYIIIMHICS